MYPTTLTRACNYPAGDLRTTSMHPMMHPTPRPLALRFMRFSNPSKWPLDAPPQFGIVIEPLVANAPGQIAQLVEQRTENPRVGGSTPSLTTIDYSSPPRVGFFNAFSTTAATPSRMPRALFSRLPISISRIARLSTTNPRYSSGIHACFANLNITIVRFLQLYLL